ncbi:MAG: hypothetical protein EXR13_00865 [Candidatus Fonsibacter sp.]|nr:hypothetical protein [Candidatus Fonsibacter sp.]
MFIKINSYLFTDNLYKDIKKKIRKFKNLSIVYNYSKESNINHNKIKILSNYCKKNKIKLFIKDSLKLAIQFKANGIYLTEDNKKSFKNLITKQIQIIGSAHNQREYFSKLNQGCSVIMLSPIFFNEKYSKYKILGVNKFNLITKNWICEIGALGGILQKNLKMIYMTNSKNIGFVRLFNEI